ncbi:MAG: hypothetical protein WB809_05805, partial [Thermoplasmata archaeon]
MSFFRRLRRDKEEPPSEEPTEPATEDEGTIWTDANKPTPPPVEERPPAEAEPVSAPARAPAPPAPVQV